VEGRGLGAEPRLVDAEALIRDLRFAVRSLLRARGLAATVIVTLQEGAMIAAIGTAAGAAGGYVVTRLAADFFTSVQLPGVEPLMAATAILITAAMAASLLPAARAARINVLDALRSE
jgi:hypothetical protein